MSSPAASRTRMGRFVLALTLGAAFLAPALAAPSTAAAAIGACAPAGGGGGPFYPGPAGSAVYDKTFRNGATLPHIDTHVPQGLALWSNWNGKGDALLLLGSYRLGADSYLIGINPNSGKRVGTVRLAESHLGAVGVAGTWLFTTATSQSKLRKYRISALRDAMRISAKKGTKPLLKASGGSQKVLGAQFMAIYDGRVWTGRYSRSATSSKMAQYKVSSSGRLSRVGKPWEVPLQTQGVLVTKDRFVFYSGLQVGAIRVVQRGERQLSRAKGRCFAAPSFGENLIRYNGRIYLAYEGSARTDLPNVPNRIANFHTAKYSALEPLSNPR